MSKIFKNAAIVSPSYDGHANGVNFIALNENGDTNQSVPFGIVHTLDTDVFINYNSPQTGVIITPISNGFNITSDGLGVELSFMKIDITEVYPNDTPCLLNFTASVASGVCDITATYDGVSNVLLDYTVVSGDNGVELKGRGLTYVSIAIDATQSFNVDFIFNAVKQITNPNSYLTLQDKATEAHQTIDNSTGTPSTKYNQDKSCANIFTTNVPVTDADRVICDADELAIFKLVKGDLTTGLSFAASNVKNLSLGNEGVVGGSSVYDTVNDTSIVISGYTANCRDYFKNLDTKGPNRLLIEEDASGRAIAVREDYSVNLKNPQGKKVGIGYKPNTPNYTIMEVSSGELQDFGGELTTDGDMSNPAAWVTGTGVTIAGDLCSFVDVVNYSLAAYQGITVSDNTDILVSIKVLNYVKGEITAFLGGEQTGTENPGIAQDGVLDFIVNTGISFNGNLIITCRGTTTGDIDTVSVKELIGTTQREEFRVITHEDGVGDELRVNHVEQPTPALPDPDVFMNITGTANIGYPDTIDTAHAKLMVWTSVKTPAEQLAFINDVIAATREVLTDENDVPLEDENGMYQYT